MTTILPGCEEDARHAASNPHQRCSSRCAARAWSNRFVRLKGGSGGNLGDSKVSQFEDVSVEEDVGELDVSVDDALLACRAQRRPDH